MERVREFGAGVMGAIDCESEFVRKKETPAGSRREFRSYESRLLGAGFNEDSLPRCDGWVNTDLKRSRKGRAFESAQLASELPKCRRREGAF
jgi:hypothetical protein